MAITRLVNDTVVSNATAGTRTVVRPPDIETNDVMVAHVTNSGGTAIASWTIPSGWVTVADCSTSANPRAAVFYKIATASEPADYSWSGFGASGGGSINVGGWRGVDLGTTIDVTGTVVTGSTQPFSLTGVTTVTANAMLIASIFENSSSTTGITAPSESPAWDYAWQHNIQRINVLAFVLKATAGATGNKAFTDNKGSLTRIGLLWALRPAAGATVAEMQAAQQQQPGWPFPRRPRVTVYAA